jgi:hypothetical protein
MLFSLCKILLRLQIYIFYQKEVSKHRESDRANKLSSDQILSPADRLRRLAVSAFSAAALIWYPF